MKKIAVGLLVVLVLGAAFLAGLSGSGASIFGWALNPQKAVVEKLSAGFLEDIQFKDFPKASEYHTFDDQAKVDIPVLIERLFQVKPEQLKIDDIRITEVDLDHTGDRARTFFTATTEVLNSARKPEEGQQNKKRSVEGILYWHKRPKSEALPPPQDAEGKPLPRPPVEPGEEEQWFMRLESSLH